MFSSFEKNNVKNEYLEILNWLLEDYGYVWLTTRTNLVTIQRIILNAIFNAGHGEYKYMKPKDIVLSFIQTILEEEFYLKYHSDFIITEDKDGQELPKEKQEFNLRLYQEVIRNALYYQTYIQTTKEHNSVFEFVDSFLLESVVYFPKLSPKESDVYFERSKYLIFSKLAKKRKDFSSKFYTQEEKIADLNYFFSVAVFYFDKRSCTSFFTYCNLVLSNKFVEELDKVSNKFAETISLDSYFQSEGSFFPIGNSNGDDLSKLKLVDELHNNNVLDTEDDKYISSTVDNIFKGLTEEEEFMLRATWGIGSLQLKQNEIADMLGYNQGGISKKIKTILETIKENTSAESINNVLNIIYK